jgi:hypothetical protein
MRFPLSLLHEPLLANNGQGGVAHDQAGVVFEP